MRPERLRGGQGLISDYLDESCGDHHEADLCIVGAGPAGIAIAMAFVGLPFRVLLLESGGLDSEPPSQALNRGTSVGPAHLDPAMSRLRAFGGSCRLWGGGCIPLSRLDLEPRPWVPHSGWPIGYEELERYCRRALEVCDIGEHRFGDGTFLAGGAPQPVAFDPQLLVHRHFIESSVFFGARYHATLARAANVELLLHANLVELVPDADAGHIQSARIGSIDGRLGTVRARHYVLAAGGIENARLLLLSDSVKPGGLGNDHDLVGRYFMDHPRCVAGSLRDGDFDRLARAYEHDGTYPAAPLYPEISLSDAAQRRLGLLNGRARPFAVQGHTPAGVQALRDLRASFRNGVETAQCGVEADVLAALTRDMPVRAQAALPGSVPRRRLALQIGLHPGDIARAAARRMRGRPAVRSERVDVMTYFEQAPNPDSRITLGEQRDAFGQRTVQVDWRLTALDMASYRATATLIGDQFARSCNARFEPAPWVVDEAVPPQLHSTAHHIGTTRMAERPEQGVVDRHCRVHGIDNLHVAGSSVFPTGGWAFPTFTIVALALRLADRLRPGLEIAGI